MADFRALSTDDYSNLANWEYSTDGGSSWNPAIALPSSGDDVYANSFNITFDVDVEASKFSNEATTGVSAGGTFYFGAGDFAVGDFESGENTSVCVYNNSGSGKTITGDLTTIRAICLRGNSQVTVIGNVTSIATQIDSSCVRYVPNLVVTGTARGSDYSASSVGRWGHGVQDCSDAEVGTAIGQRAYGVYMGSGVATVTNAHKLDSLADGDIAVFGDITVSNIRNDVDSQSLLGGSARLESSNITVIFTVPQDGGSTVEVSYLAGSANYPAEADVENGVVYGNSNQFTGTLEQVDTSQLATDLLDEIQTSSHVVAQRLRAAATDDSVGDIVTSTLGA